MATARQMAARTWELHSEDVIFFGGMIVFAICVVISPILGAIAGYIFCILFNAMVWEKRLPTFSWTDNDRLRWSLVALGPVTALCIAVGCWLYIMFAPFLLMWSIRRDKLKAGEPTAFNKKNWAIGICVYYAALTGLIIWMVNLVQA